MAGVVLSPTSLSVVPGGEAVCVVTVRNSSSVVDSYAVSVLGDAAAWATVTPATLSLFPGADGTVQIHFRPPRQSVVRAGTVDFAVRVVSSETDDSIVEEASLTIEPFADIAARITPRNSEAKRKARHVVTVENKGNAPVTVNVSASDPDEALAFEPSPPTLTIAPGDTAASSISVAARSRSRGPAQHRQFQATVMPSGGADHAPVILDASMVQKGGIPKFVPPLVAAAIVGAIAIVVVPGLLKDDKGGGTFNLSSASNPTTTAVTAPAAGGEEAEADAEAEAAAEGAAGGGGGEAPVTTAPAKGTTAAASSGGQAAATTTTAPKAVGQTATTAIPSAPAASLPKPKTTLPILVPSFEGDTDEEIWKINPDGTGKTKLTNFPQPQWSVGARWNYAGSMIVFTHANGPAHVWIMNGDGSNQHDATPACETQCSQASWSADGRRIAYIKQVAGSSQNDIWYADVSAAGVTSNHRPVVATPADEQYPVFAPDGRLAFQRNASGWKVVVRQSDGTEGTVANGFHPSWSPNNDRLIYTDGNEVWTTKLDGNAPSNVSNAPSSAEQWPAFSPDGSRVLFATTRWDGGQWNAAIAELNGTIVKQLTGATGRHWWVGWF